MTSTESKSASTLTVGILVFNGVEVLDFSGPFEVFSDLWSDPDENGEMHPMCRAVTIGETEALVTCSGGLKVSPEATISNHPALDVLLIPGGHVADVMANSDVLEWIKKQDQQTKVTASVCTGALVLAKCGLLKGKRATTHWGSIEHMRERFPEVEVLANTRFVDEGHVITSAGISAGIDMSLHLLERFFGAEAATLAARGMEYERHSSVA
jgi:transcriptional regulator GlxA family with amidase domain